MVPRVLWGGLDRHKDEVTVEDSERGLGQMTDEGVKLRKRTREGNGLS